MAALGTAGVIGFSVLRGLGLGQNPVIQFGAGSVDMAAGGGASPALRDADDVPAVLMPRAWRQAK